MASKLKIPSSKVIAQELALDLSEAACMPNHVTHVPGVMNVWADALYRLSDPRGHYRVPSQLLSVARSVPSRRAAAFYTTLAATALGGP